MQRISAARLLEPGPLPAHQHYSPDLGPKSAHSLKETKTRTMIRDSPSVLSPTIIYYNEIEENKDFDTGYKGYESDSDGGKREVREIRGLTR